MARVELSICCPLTINWSDNVSVWISHHPRMSGGPAGLWVDRRKTTCSLCVYQGGGGGGSYRLY